MCNLTGPELVEIGTAFAAAIGFAGMFFSIALIVKWGR